jgi:hypothetical protein
VHTRCRDVQCAPTAWHSMHAVQNMIQYSYVERCTAKQSKARHSTVQHSAAFHCISTSHLRGGEGYVQVEYDADLEPCVSEQLGQFHQVVVVHPHNIVILDVRNQAVEEGLVRG